MCTKFGEFSLKFDELGLYFSRPTMFNSHTSKTAKIIKR